MSSLGSSSGKKISNNERDDNYEEDHKFAENCKETNLVSDQFRWISLKMIKYKDDVGVERPWESAFRTTRKGDVDAVFIVANVKRPGEKDCILMISQFRPPCESYVIEFPAGLVDEGEDAERAALRELREETGYFGEVKQVSPMIDCGKDLNKNPKSMQDEGEHILTHLIEKDKFLYYMRNPKLIEGLRHPKKKVTVSGLAFSFALSISMFST